MNAEIVMIIGNIVCLIGTLMQVKDVYRYRNRLKGYSFIGSLLTLSSVLLFLIGFFMFGQYLSVIIGTATFLYWLLITIYTGREIVRNRK